MPHYFPDQWFTQAQIDRLCNLMTQWRNARENGFTFPYDKQVELESLVEEELLASTLRAQDTLDHDSRSTNQ